MSGTTDGEKQSTEGRRFEHVISVVNIISEVDGLFMHLENVPRQAGELVSRTHHTTMFAQSLRNDDGLLLHGGELFLSLFCLVFCRSRFRGG